MSDRITVNIHGSCVTRDAFELFDPENGPVKIARYVSRNSIFSSVCKPLKLSGEDYTSTKPFLKRMVSIDFKKEVFSYFEQGEADYLVIDLIDERFNLLQFVSDKQMIITYSSNFKASDILSNHPFYSKLEYNFIDTADLSDELIKKAVNEYSRRILKLYPKERIVINETYLSGHYVAKDGSIRRFKDAELQEYKQLNEKLKKLYKYLIKALGVSDENIIRMPKDNLAYEDHKWGLAPFHFTDEYYQNVTQRFLEIVNSHNS